jgi:hypothetical protein
MIIAQKGRACKSLPLQFAGSVTMDQLLFLLLFFNLKYFGLFGEMVVLSMKLLVKSYKLNGAKGAR